MTPPKRRNRTYTLTDTTGNRVKAVAAEEGWSASDWVEAALQHVLELRDKQPRRYRQAMGE